MTNALKRLFLPKHPRSREDGTIQPDSRWIDCSKTLDLEALAQSRAFQKKIDEIEKLEQVIKGH